MRPGTKLNIVLHAVDCRSAFDDGDQVSLSKLGRLIRMTFEQLERQRPSDSTVEEIANVILERIGFFK